VLAKDAANAVVFPAKAWHAPQLPHATFSMPLSVVCAEAEEGVVAPGPDDTAFTDIKVTPAGKVTLAVVKAALMRVFALGPFRAALATASSCALACTVAWTCRLLFPPLDTT